LHSIAFIQKAAPPVHDLSGIAGRTGGEPGYDMPTLPFWRSGGCAKIAKAPKCDGASLRQRTEIKVNDATGFLLDLIFAAARHVLA